MDTRGHDTPTMDPTEEREPRGSEEPALTCVYSIKTEEDDGKAEEAG